MSLAWGISKEREMSSAVIFQLGAKLLVTGGLLFLIILCSIEIWRLWLDRTEVLVAFEYMRDGKSVPESGADFARLVDTDLSSLVDIYTDNKIVIAGAGQTGAAGTVQSGRAQPLQLPKIRESELASFEIQAYGVQVSSILKALNRFLVRPNEIHGRVTEHSGEFTVDAEIRSFPGWSKQTKMKWQRFHAMQESAVSFELACRIFRRAHGVETELLMTSDDEFCGFSRVLRSYERYRELVANPWRKEDSIKALDELDKSAAALGIRDDVSPYTYKLIAYIYRDKDKKPEAKIAIDRHQAGLKKVGREDKEAKIFADGLGEKAASVALGMKLKAVLRPVQPGASISVLGSTSSGAICCIVKDKANTDTRYVLSVDYIFDGNPGAKIVQPAQSDEGVIATLTKKRDVKPYSNNTAAGAIAKVNTGIEVDPEIPDIGKIKGIANNVNVGDSVQIIGPESGRVKCRVQKAGIPASQNRNGVNFDFVNMIEVDTGSKSADKGAPVFTEDNKLVGMVYMSNPNSTIVMPIDPILSALDVDLFM